MIEPLFVMLPDVKRTEFAIVPVALFVMSPEEERILSLLPPVILPLFVMGPPERLMFVIDPLFAMPPVAELSWLNYRNRANRCLLSTQEYLYRHPTGRT